MTGSGGAHFEAHVQSAFVVLMLSGGFAPCIPSYPINKIKLQAKAAGYDTDDMIVFVEKGNQQRKILCQIKHSINITENDEIFSDVIQAAWNDFNNASIFSKGKDVIALITGPLSATDINDVRTILEWARQYDTEDEFIEIIEKTRISSQSKQRKLQSFKTNLKKANGGNSVSDKELFEFLRHFHLLGYDLDIKAGVTLSLIHSLIGQYSQEKAVSLWAQVVDEVQSANKNAGTITRENLREELIEAFTQRPHKVIPAKFSIAQVPQEFQGWNNWTYAPDLAVVNLLGSWNENNEADINAIKQLLNRDSGTWLSNIRNILQLSSSPLTLKNGKWHVIQREKLWDALATRIFDSDLENFKKICINVLTESDPQFELPIEDRFAASIHGKKLKYSPELRKGMAESLAILANRTQNLTNCSLNKPKSIAVLAVREILVSADWKLWGSLNDLLPLLAEAAPNEFLNAAELALQQSPSPFEQLFPRRNSGITDRNYITGLLWALETLAWEEEFLVRVCVILGELSTRDPGETNWVNRPLNSLRTILLPWFPQTMASIEKRKVAIQTLQREFPTVAWDLLLSLLPNQHQTTTGSYKPALRLDIPEDWGRNIPAQEYWDQVLFYAETVVLMARNDTNKLPEIIKNLDNFPKPSFDRILELFSSENISGLPENQRMVIWNNLTKYIFKHKRYPNAKWALPIEIISKIEDINSKLAPANPLNLYHRLFDERDIDLFEERGNWEEQRLKLEKQRQLALNEILEYGDIKAVFEFAENVQKPSLVGLALGTEGNSEIDEMLLPKYLEAESPKLIQFTGGYIWNSQQTRGWSWVDGLDKSKWSKTQISQFLRCLPFTVETWDRVSLWLNSAEKEYWSKVNVNPYETNDSLEFAIDQLLKYDRPNAAIDCISKIHNSKKPLNQKLTVRALLNAISSKEDLGAMDTFNIIEIIKELQDNTETNPDDLFQIEWAYLPLLDRYQGASPKLLESRLASDPVFFCEAIRLVYRSKKENKSKIDTTENEKAIATNAWRLLHEWKTPPGTLPDGTFSTGTFKEWLEKVKNFCTESGHLEVALTHVGHVLFYCPSDSEGLWINQAVAEALNSKDAEDMRNGFKTETFNSRGVHWIDPTGKPERELAEQYRQKAHEIENAGYQRFAATIRILAEEYDLEADRIISEHLQDSES